MVVKIVVVIVILLIGITLYACCKTAGDADERMGIK
jgi:hypothetical protein